MSDDLYQILEVEPQASAQEIRKAYYRLAKLYHPDLQDEDDASATERFLLIQKAYKILSSPEERRAYDRQRQQPTATAKLREAVESFEQKWGTKTSTLEEEKHARLAYMKAESLLESGDVTKAIQLMEAVVRTVPDQPEYQSLYGYALAMNGERLHRARDACRRALEVEPQNADYHAHLGYVYLRAGLKQTAESCFAEALRINPVHPIARVHKADEARATGGLFSGLKRIFSGA